MPPERQQETWFRLPRSGHPMYGCPPPGAATYDSRDAAAGTEPKQQPAAVTDPTPDVEAEPANVPRGRRKPEPGDGGTGED